MVKNLWRTTWAIFAAIALIAALGAPSAFAGGQTVDQFYGSTKVYDIYMNIPQASLTSLATLLEKIAGHDRPDLIGLIRQWNRTRPITSK